MATILFRCLDTPSHYNATYKLAQELKMRGHRIVYIGHQSFQETVIRQGFEFHRHYIFPFWGKPSKETFLKRMISGYGILKKNEDYYLKGLPLGDVIKMFKPDLFILDVSLNFLFPILVEKQVKFFIYNTKVNLTKTYLIPPVTSSYIPKSNVWSAMRVEMLWQNRFMEKRVLMLYDKIRCFGKSNYELVKKYLQSLDVNYRKIIDTKRVGHFGIKSAPEIILSLQEFDFRNTIADNQFYMCPCVSLSRNELINGSDVSDFFKRIEAKKNFDRVVYCSFGSYDSKFRLVRIKFLVKLINIFLRKKNYLLVVSTGNDINPRWFNVEAPNIYLGQSVPQLEILSHCDLMINQGGMQSVQECILKQVPMLVYPLNPGLDQEGNAARVLYHGLGLRGNIRKDKDDEIENKVERVLNDNSFKTTLIRFQKQCLENDSFERGLQFIESYIETKNNSVAPLQ